MKDDKIIEKLHIPFTKACFNLHVRAFNNGIEIVQRRCFLRRQGYPFLLRPLDGIAVVTTMQIAVGKGKDRNSFGGQRRLA